MFSITLQFATQNSDIATQYRYINKVSGNMFSITLQFATQNSDIATQYRYINKVSETCSVSHCNLLLTIQKLLHNIDILIKC